MSNRTQEIKVCEHCAGSGVVDVDGEFWGSYSYFCPHCPAGVRALNSTSASYEPEIGDEVYIIGLEGSGGWSIDEFKQSPLGVKLAKIVNDTGHLWLEAIKLAPCPP